MIRLENVNKYFNKRKSNEIHVINNTSIELEDKGLVAFLGNSGCGKTTLLNAIGGLDKVNSGDIYIGDERLTRRAGWKKDEIRNANIGYIFQNYNLIEDQTVFFNVEIVLRMMGIKDKEEIKNRVLFILEKTGIERYKNRPVKALSGGERQRVGIARALVKNPKIIIADEPTGNLDSRNTIEIMNIIKAVSKEKLVILVTHERDLAEFYASRIVEIVDGKIVSDKENDNESALEYHMENKIFLKDMEVQKSFKEDNVNISYFSDSPEKDINVKVVVKNNNIYIELPEGYREGSETTELVDGHYEKITKDMYEDYKFEYSEIKGKNGKIKYHSIFSFWKILVNGYKKVFNYSILKKILLLGFVFASLLTMYSVSTIFASKDIKDEKFLTTNRDYITVEAGRVTLDMLDKYSNRDGIEYVVPGTGTRGMQIYLNDYYQTANEFAYMSGAIADLAKVKKSDLIAGRLPENSGEIVIDKMLADKTLKDGTIKQIGIKTPADFIGRKIKGGNAGDLVITGITDMHNPVVYVESNMFFKFITSGKNSDMESDGEVITTDVADYHDELEKGNIELKAGSLPDEDYEVMVPYEMYGTYYVGSTSDVKVNGEKLRISGFYTDKYIGRDINFVGEKTWKMAVLEKCDKFVIVPEDKAATFSELKDEGVKVVDNYKVERKDYMEVVKDKMFSTLMVSAIILLISVIEIYLILRASFLSRIKEVGVLRAIGLKKKDVYKMFLGEIIAMTTITAIPSMAVLAYILENLEGLPFVGEFILMNTEVFVISFVIIVISNLIFGLLPVFNTMRKTPAAILARNDVN